MLPVVEPETKAMIQSGNTRAATDLLATLSKIKVVGGSYGSKFDTIIQHV